MPKETISVCIERDEKAASDAIAAQSDCDLSLVVEEALSAYAALTIRWTKQAIADIDNVYDFISASNPRGESDDRHDRSRHHRLGSASQNGTIGSHRLSAREVGRDRGSVLASPQWPIRPD